MPKNCRDASHDCHPGDLRTATHLDPAVPVSHFRITLQEMQNQLSQDKAGDLAALFGDRTQSILRLAGVATSGSQAEVVGQAPRTRKTFDGPDSTRQRQATVMADARRGHEELGRVENVAWLLVTCSFGDFFIPCGQNTEPDSKV